jgi:flagellar motor switch protein FliG
VTGADLRKAAVLLRSLPDDAAAQLLLALSVREVEVVQAAMAGTSNVTVDEQLSVLRDFAAATHVPRQATHQGQATFDFLERVDHKILLSLLSNESPQACALVISQSPTASAAELLLALPADLRPDIIERIATIGQVRCDVLHDVAQALAERVAALHVQRAEFVDGAIAAADVLASFDQARERTLHKSVAELGRVDRGVIDRAWRTAAGDIRQPADLEAPRNAPRQSPERRVA